VTKFPSEKKWNLVDPASVMSECARVLRSAPEGDISFIELAAEEHEAISVILKVFAKQLREFES
jgi:hypothetical protein